MGEQTVRQPNAGSIEQTHQHSPTRTHRLASCSWQPSVKVRPVLFQTAARRLGAKSDSAVPLPLFRTRSYLCWLCTDPAGSVPTLAGGDDSANIASAMSAANLHEVQQITLNAASSSTTRFQTKKCSVNCNVQQSKFASRDNNGWITVVQSLAYRCHA